MEIGKYTEMQRRHQAIKIHKGVTINHLLS